jgi:hypothetical protein
MRGGLAWLEPAVGGGQREHALTSHTSLHVMDPLNKVFFFLIKLSSILEPQHLAVQVEPHV